MRKRIVAFAALLGLALGGLGASAVPAHACSNAQAQTYATLSGSSVTDSVQAQMPIGSLQTPYDNFYVVTSHWVGVQDNTTQNLVQAGYNIVGYYNLTPSYGFFYEFVGPGGTAGAISITLGYTWSPGDMFLFKLWHHDSNSWGLQIKDVTRDVNGDHLWSHYIYATGYSDSYIGHTAIVATENQCGNDLFNDGVQTIKQPAYHIKGTSWSTYHFFGDGVAYNGSANLIVGGHTLETGSTTDSNAYAYHTWKAFN